MTKERLNPNEMIPVYVILGKKGTIVVEPKYKEWYRRNFEKDSKLVPRSYDDFIENRHGQAEATRFYVEMELPLALVGERDKNYRTFDNLGDFENMLEKCGNSLEQLKSKIGAAAMAEDIMGGI